MLTVEELWALGRSLKPTWLWNKYKQVTRDDDMKQYLCSYKQLFRTPWGDDVDWTVDNYTMDERYAFCWFEWTDHWIRVVEEYEEKKPLPF